MQDPEREQDHHPDRCSSAVTSFDPDAATIADSTAEGNANRWTPERLNAIAALVTATSMAVTALAPLVTKLL